MLKSYPNLTMRNHTYYARFSIPKHLVEIAKRKNFYCSLFTNDYYKALHKVKEYAYKTDLLIQSYERKYQEMLKLKHKNTGDIRLCLTYAEVQHIFVQWWWEVLNKVVRYEGEIKSGKKTFKDFCFYKPIPQKILDMGFLKYVADRKKHKHKKLFELKYNKDNKYTKAVGKWFAGYLEKLDIVGSTKVFHSFRHNLVQNMKMLGYVDSYAIEIGGWSKNSDRRAYASYNNGMIPLKNLKEALDKLEFSMIDWDKLKVRPTDMPKKRAYHRSKIRK